MPEMPKWVHDRAEHIMDENPSMPKSEAFAIASQQAHATGKAPKDWGTKEGKETAKEKYDKPKDEYQKKAADVYFFEGEVNQDHPAMQQMLDFFSQSSIDADALRAEEEAFGKIAALKSLTPSRTAATWTSVPKARPSDINTLQAGVEEAAKQIPPATATTPR